MLAMTMAGGRAITGIGISEEWLTNYDRLEA